MNQSKDYTLHMCKSDIKKIGHNLDASVWNYYSMEVYSEQQIPITGNSSLNQLLSGSQFFLPNNSYFEALSTLTTTYYIKKTFWNSSAVNYSKSNNNTTLTFKVEYQE